MRPSQIRKRLSERLGYLEAQLARGTMPPHRARYNEEEAHALRSVLKLAGLLEPRLLEQKVRAVMEKVLPVEERKFARRVHWRQQAEELAVSIQRAARVV